VALLDIEMPVLDGIDATARILAGSPSTRVLILTTFGRPGYLRRAMDAGARGFVVKDAPVDRLATAVRDVHHGRTVVDPDLAVASLSSGPSPLTEREREVLRASADGATAAALATRLALSEGTVRNYLSSAIGKTAARNRVEAVRIARDRGWL
jgi:two-component system response regulator DesR